MPNLGIAEWEFELWTGSNMGSSEVGFGLETGPDRGLAELLIWMLLAPNVTDHSYFDSVYLKIFTALSFLAN